MNRCVLHVGMFKTGTSSIQKSLAEFTDANSVYYQDHKGRTNHGAAVFDLLGSTIQGRNQTGGGSETSALRAPDRETREQFDRTFRSLGHRTLIISGEAMVLLSAAELRKLAAYFQESHIGKIEIVAYVRPFAAYVTSIARATKGGILRGLNLERRSSSYREDFEKFDEIFGRENVHLYKFDPQLFPSGCVVQDLCTKLGVDLPTEHIVRVNESISREAVALLYIYYKLGRELGSASMTMAQRFQLVQRMGSVGRTKFSFSPDLLRPMLEKNRADIEWMEARLGQSLHEELGERQPGDVCEEWDLLRPDPAVVEKLLELLGDAAPKGVKGETPEEVALLVHALRGEGGSATPSVRPARGAGKASMSAGPGRRPILVAELLEAIERTDPKLLNGISRQEAQALVRNVFKHMSMTLAAMDEGGVSYAGLGHFQVRKVEKENDGMTTRPHIRFRPMDLSGAKAESG